ncbi:unnamed protein product, partial [Thlaspi arvense]
MAEGKPDEQLFQLLSGLLQQVESLTNTEEVELRSKIEALGLELTKVPSKSSQHLNERLNFTAPLGDDDDDELHNKDATTNKNNNS